MLIFLEAPTFTHQELITELLFEIKLFIRAKKGICRVLPSPLDVQIDCDDRTIVQPDIALICKEERITRKGIYGRRTSALRSSRIPAGRGTTD